MNLAKFLKLTNDLSDKTKILFSYHSLNEIEALSQDTRGDAVFSGELLCVDKNFVVRYEINQAPITTLKDIRDAVKKHHLKPIARNVIFKIDIEDGFRFKHAKSCSQYGDNVILSTEE